MVFASEALVQVRRSYRCKVKPIQRFVAASQILLVFYESQVDAIEIVKRSDLVSSRQLEEIFVECPQIRTPAFLNKYLVLG